MRAVKAVVIILGIMIVIALVAVIWAIFNLDKTADTPSADSRTLSELAEPVSLGLPEGCVIADMQLDGARLAVRTEGPPGVAACERIYIVNLNRGTVVRTIER